MDVSEILPRDLTLPPAGEVTVLSTSWCGYCRRLKGALDGAGITYAEVDVERAPAVAELVETVNHGDRIVPTVLFPDGTTATNPSLAEVRDRLA